MDVLKIEAKGRKIIRVGERDYALAFPLNTVAELEEKLGRSMKMGADWLRLQTREVQPTLAAGFRLYHPDEADSIAETICSTLDPEEIDNVIEALCVATCPKTMERVKKAMEEAQERLKKGLSPLPNGVGADAS